MKLRDRLVWWFAALGVLANFALAAVLWWMTGHRLGYLFGAAGIFAVVFIGSWIGSRPWAWSAKADARRKEQE